MACGTTRRCWSRGSQVPCALEISSCARTYRTCLRMDCVCKCACVCACVHFNRALNNRHASVSTCKWVALAQSRGSPGKNLSKTLRRHFDEWGTTINMPLTAGGFAPIHVARANAMLPSLLADCPALRELVFKAAVPGSYHTVLVYMDDVIPGNILMPNHTRKFSAIYFTFPFSEEVGYLEERHRLF